MSIPWPMSTLREAGVSLIDCDHRTPPAATAGYAYIAIPQLKNGRLELEGVRRITEAHYREWTRKASPARDDVILSRRCNPGETAVVPGGLECALGQNLVLLRADGTNVHAPFLRWLVRGPDWWDQVRKFINVGAVFDSLKCADIPNFELPLPPISEQRAIAQILGTLDDKIEVNRRTNETLEAMARALFKSWFVDFDPVHAKKDGRKPEGMDAATAALFPSGFDDSESGAVPKGWQRTSLGELVSALSGGTPSKSEPSLWEGDIPWISPKVMKSIHVYASDATVSPDALGNGTRLAPAGSTLVMVRGMGLHEHVRVSQAARDVAFNQDVKALVPKRIHVTLLFFALLDGQAELLTRVDSSGHGTGRLPSDILLSHPIVMPASAAQDVLARPFDSMNEKMQTLRAQTDSLSTLRDALLPKLLAGELRVPEADRVVGKAV